MTTRRFQARYYFAAVFAVCFVNAATACEPVWVRPVDVARYRSVMVGRVEAVDLFRGRITVAPVRSIVGKPSRVTVHYNNVPLTCGSQSFRPGERVYVFDAEWAAPVNQVTFAPAVR